MIITRTPYRISFFGGGSDYPAWYRDHGGAVLSATIDKYCYISLRRMPSFLGSKYRVFWSKMEAVDRLEDIEHPGVRGCLQYLGIEDGIEVNHAGDLPARSGLGSSSAFTVGMLNALHAMEGRPRSKTMLAQHAIEVEQTVLAETVGIQDQIACAHGGVNLIEIGRDGAHKIEPMHQAAGQRLALQDRLLLVYTGLQRHASEIAKAQVDRMEINEGRMRAIVDLVPLAVAALKTGQLADFGRLLHDSWRLKRALSEQVSNPEIDAIYDLAINAGALGGKVLGAGGGGFMLFYVPSGKKQAVIDALSLLTVPVRFSQGGSEIVFCDP